MNKPSQSLFWKTVVVFSFLLFFAPVAFAQLKELPEGPKTAAELIKIIENITDWVFAIFVTISVIFFLLAAFQFVREGGDPAKVIEARQKLIYAAIGIGIALLANGFPRVLRNILT